MAFSDLFKRGKKTDRAEPHTDIPEDDIPTLDSSLPEGSLAQAATQAHFRGRESADEIESMPPDEGLPSVNRSSAGSNLARNVGYAAAGLVGIALLVVVNSPKTPKASQVASKSQSVQADPDKVSSAKIPPLQLPDVAPPPPIATPPAGQSQSVLSAMTGVPAHGDAQPIGVVGAGNRATARGGKTPPDWTERKMSGEGSMLIGANGMGGGGGGVTPIMAPGRGHGDDDEAEANLVGGGGKSDLGQRLEGTTFKPAKASLLKDRSFLITKGTALDCALETAIDTTLPGILTCRLTRDVYSDNGQVLLMERGTQMVGEQSGNVRQGQARVFALWSRAKTPKGVIVNLNSPGTDSLGRSGLEGWVDRHFAERFGAAIMMSFIKGTIDGYVAKQSQNSGSTNVYGNVANSGERIIEEVLKSTVNIPPTIIKNQGDHIQIMVARDLDFSTVYGLSAE